MPPRPFLSDRSSTHILKGHGTPPIGTIFSDTAFAAIGSDNDNDVSAQTFLSSTPLPHIITPRNTSSNSSSTIGIVLGSISGFLVLLAIIYVCYFRHYSTMYIVSRSSSATSSKASQRSRRRRRRQPVIAGLPRPREVIVVDVMRTRTSAPAAPAPAPAEAAAPADPAPPADAAAEG